MGEAFYELPKTGLGYFYKTNLTNEVHKTVVKVW